MIGRILIVGLMGLCLSPILRAQQKLNTPNTVTVSNTGAGKFYYAGRNEPARAIEFKPGTVPASTFSANINAHFNIPAGFTFREAESNTDHLGMRHRWLQQYYNDMLIENMGYRVHEKNGFITSANGRAIRDIKLNTQILLSKEQAYQLAKTYLKAQDTTSRNGRQLIVSKGFTFTPESFSIAFQFDIDVSFLEKWRISIDARSGEVINKVSLVNSCSKDHESPPPYTTATGKTSYYGNQTIRVEESGYGTRMRGQTAHGGQIGTYDFQNAPTIMLTLFFDYHRVYDFGSPNNIYDVPGVQPAVSAQWSAEQVFEYYFIKHNRNSYDNNGSEIRCYAHVDNKLNNAFWVNKVLALGDGDNNNPLVELDVIGHELTHGVTESEAGLQYSNEPGALNESFSDIMGKAIEFYTFGDTATWQLARHFSPGGLRDLSNPNRRNQPDTFGGDLWVTGYEDYGGVHSNSGVQNFWFYLLSEGGSGINDLKMPYAINPIGIEAAANIAYRNLTEYLSFGSDYLDSRIGSLLATADLYGNGSTIYQEVDKAWDAVGVIDEPSITSLSTYDITATTAGVRGMLIPRSNVVTYQFEYGTTPALGTSTPVYTYIDKVDATLTGLQSQTKYYLKLVATNEHGSTSRMTEFTTISLAPLVKIKQTVDVTETTASLYGQVNPNSLSTSFYFEYGTTPSLGQVTSTFQLPPSTVFIDVSANVSGLQPRQSYYYRLKATNNVSTATTDVVSFYTAVKPVITSFSPVVATIGSEITILGSNFNTTPGKNLVNFGATRGLVVSASPTTIKVNVPAGASFGNISVVDAESGLAAKSTQEFVPTFTAEFKKSNIRMSMGVNDLYVYKTFVEDMDGDGRPDIVASHYQGFTVFQNVNQGGDLDSASFIRDTHNLTDFSGLYVADLDGNGLKDVIGRYPRGIRILPNLSVPGYIFFGPPVDVPIEGFEYLLFEDFDMDGHTDIAGIKFLDGGLQQKIAIIRNQNPKGFIDATNFDLRLLFDAPNYVGELAASDVNNDGTPDILISAYYNVQNALPVLKNISRSNFFEFEETRVQDAWRGYSAQYLAHDLNNDGWKDVISYSRNEKGNLSLLTNRRTPQNITTNAGIVALSDQAEAIVKPGDMDGDGKTDLMVAVKNRKFIFLKNNGATGNDLTTATFENFATYGMYQTVNGSVEPEMSINDLNGDGRPDIINTNQYYYGPRDGYIMEIWQNKPDSCIDPSRVTVVASNNSATVMLPQNTTMDQFEIDYTLADYEYWQRLSSTTINYLSSGYNYKLRIRARCYLGFTDYSYVTFNTDCVDTNSFAITNIAVDYVVIDARSLGSFEVQYSLSGQDNWEDVPQYVNQITGLLPGTRYDIRFRGRCYKPVDYTYKEFTTLCPKIKTLSVTDLEFNHARVNWSSNYEGDVQLEYSIDNATWTTVDESLILSPLDPATTYYLRGKMVCADTLSEYLTTRFTTPCSKVSSLTFDRITPFSARASWVDEVNTGNYIVTYAPGPDGLSVTLQTQSSYLALDGLAPGTQYTITVTPRCNASQIATSASFTTACYGPFDATLEEVMYTTANFSWSENFMGIPYVVEYSIAGSNVWKTAKADLTQASLTGLRPGTKYEARIHIHCPAVAAPYASVFFETDLYEETAFSPNPTDSKVTIRPSKNLIGTRYNLYDNMGRVLAQGELTDYTIDLSGYSYGVYTLQIEGEKPMRIVKY